MERLGDICLTGTRIKGANQKLIHYYSTLVWSFIDSYYVSLGYLYRLQKEKKSELIANISFFAETLYFERVIDHYECTSRETIKHALKLFKV